MFAFGGASTFPTIQADMADKSQFKLAAVLAMTVLFIIYFPTAAAAYFSLGTCVNQNILQSMSKGGLRVAAECVILLHLVAALPIVINPPSQYFEEVLKIPKGNNGFSRSGLDFDQINVCKNSLRYAKSATF